LDGPSTPKVCIFAWKLAGEGLATQCDRRKRNLTDVATCHICGRDEESGYHAVVHELRNYLALPEEGKFAHTDPDWLLLLLNAVRPEVKASVLLLLRRAWFLGNDATFEKGEALIGPFSREL
jgi:hypothetical protein